MKNNFDYTGQNLFTPIIFRSDFNDGSTLNVSQAWSLFFTAGQEENALDGKGSKGWFYNNLLLAVIAGGTVWALFLSVH